MSKKYFCKPEDLKKTINKYGVAIIPSVINEEECNNMISGIWDYFEHISQTWEMPIDRSNKETWKGIYSIFPLHSMLFQNFSIGQSKVCWDMRQNEKIVDIFAKFWECTKEELLVSFDGLSFNMPPEVTNRGWNRNNTWYHMDQSPTRNDFECIQSWITGLDVEKGDATLAFFEKSNRCHKKFAEKFKVTEKSDWYKLNSDEEQFFINKGCKKKKITCPKGSLVFWDSRTIHCGVEACKDRKKSKLRAVIYLCYMPRNLATEANLRKKQQAFNNIRSTSHWPHKPKLFAKTPRTYGRELPEITPIEKPNLTELGKKLAGF
jgi:hypothetical protein